MAKTIKFNLICDNSPIRTIDDLRDNFVVEDVLAYLDNGLLERWLNVRGFDEEYKMVAEINKNDNDINKVKRLIEIFDIEDDQNKIDESVYIFEYEKEKKELFKIFKQDSQNVKRVIDNYCVGYEVLRNRILDNPNNKPIIKSCIDEMVNSYRWAFVQNHRELFWWVYEKSPLAVMCLLMNEFTRNFYLPIEKTDENGNKFLDINCKDLFSKDKMYMYQGICDLANDKKLPEKLEGYLLDFSGETDGYWKDIAVGKKYMIVKMEVSSFVRSAGEHGEEFGFEDVYNKFLILDGIDYKSNNKSYHILYMEV